MIIQRFLSVIVQLALIVSLIGVSPVSAALKQIPTLQSIDAPTAKFTTAVAFDSSAPLRDLAARYAASHARPSPQADELFEARPETDLLVLNQGYTGDGALPASPEKSPGLDGLTEGTIDPPLVNFEGLSNTDNFNLFGFRVNPPSPTGDVGRSHYVEMVNLSFAVYTKHGGLLLGPVPIGALWEGFAVDDCTDPSGDPIVVYDQLEDRWLLTQFTTRDPTYYDCVAISQTGDPTGAYYRYAFSSGEFFPDYPKYGVWTNSYILTTRDFGPTTEYGVSVYALEKSRMLVGDPTARVVQFFLDSEIIPRYLMGDGLLPPDIDGLEVPVEESPAPIVGTMDDDGSYSAPFDALNIWEVDVVWDRDWASLALKAQIPVAVYDSSFPCGVVPSPDPLPTSRDCIPQPGIAGNRYLDILSYRQRPVWRLAYRHFGTYEVMVTNQSVEARPGMAGLRWYEIRRTAGVYSLYQQGTFAPDDGVHRWMGSIAMDSDGNMALGYSVANGVNIYPGIRYTGRMFNSPLGQMDLGEGTIINGSGLQMTTNSRWGDYTSMNIDPVDDCTFWYVNEYYTAAGQASSTAGWQTRIASFRLPECSFRTYLPILVKQ